MLAIFFFRQHAQMLTHLDFPIGQIKGKIRLQRPFISLIAREVFFVGKGNAVAGQGIGDNDFRLRPYHQSAVRLMDVLFRIKVVLNGLALFIQSLRAAQGSDGIAITLGQLSYDIRKSVGLILLF